MKQHVKTSVSLTEDEQGILDAMVAIRGTSRSEVMRNLIVFFGLSGGDMPLTSKILALPAKDRVQVVRSIREKAERGEFVKPAVFKQWMADILGSDDPAAIDEAMNRVVRALLGSS